MKVKQPEKNQEMFRKLRVNTNENKCLKGAEQSQPLSVQDNKNLYST